MKGLSKALVILGLILIVYAAFSRFYGAPSVAMTKFRSLSFLLLANTMLILSLIVKDYKK